MFEIQTEKFGEFTRKRIINDKTDEYISIIPEYGGNVSEIVLKKNGMLFSILDGYKTYEDLINDKAYNNAKMFPFANRIPDGKYEFDGKRYQLPINWPQENHAIHGFVDDEKFYCANEIISENSAKLILEYKYSGEIPGYPFKFLLIVEYLLDQTKGFTFTTEVQNIGDLPIPVMDGWHPYFKLGKKVDDLYLKIPVLQRTEIDDRMIPTGKLLQFDGFVDFAKIGNQFFDTGFPLELKDGIVKTELSDLEKNVTIQIWQETGKWKYNFLQIYTPPHRETIAIEPMTSNTNSFNSKDGLIVLQPGEKLRASCGVNLV